MIDDKQIRQRMLDRFLRYVKVWTTSDLHAEETPSTPQQWDLIHQLEAEMQKIGIAEIYKDPHGYLIGSIPASKGKEEVPCIGFMAHVDTALDVSGKGVNPVVREHYDGENIQISEDITLTTEESPELVLYKGETIITTDGSTLLGGDDKAGIAEIMTAVEWLLEHPEVEHGPLEVIFTPDEEIGKGMNRFPVKRLKSSFCYTIDGGREGELEVECYNAYAANVSFEGISIHPGSARGKMVNAASMAASFATMLPRSESPEATDGRYGNFWVHEMHGEVEKASLLIYLRDFDADGIQRRVQSLQAYAAAVEAQFPGGKVLVETEKQYINMREEIDKHPEITDHLIEAFRQADVTPLFKPIRGGTDGSRLTEMGIPTPNVFTGGHNMHSRKEWVGVPSMVKAVRVVLNLIGLFASK